MALDLDDLDVLCADTRNNNNYLKVGNAGKVKDFKDAVLSDIQEPVNKLFRDGYPCEILKPGFDWQEGTIKARIVFEF